MEHLQLNLWSFRSIRYTAPAFWRAGEMVFQAAAAAAPDAARHAAAAGYLHACEAHLVEVDAVAEPTPSAPSQTFQRGFLFEGQFSEARALIFFMHMHCIQLRRLTPRIRIGGLG